MAVKIQPRVVLTVVLMLVWAGFFALRVHTALGPPGLRVASTSEPVGTAQGASPSAAVRSSPEVVSQARSALSAPAGSSTAGTPAERAGLQGPWQVFEHAGGSPTDATWHASGCKVEGRVPPDTLYVLIRELEEAPFSIVAFDAFYDPSTFEPDATDGRMLTVVVELANAR